MFAVNDDTPARDANTVRDPGAECDEDEGQRPEMRLEEEQTPEEAGYGYGV